MVLVMSSCSTSLFVLGGFVPLLAFIKSKLQSSMSIVKVAKAHSTHKSFQERSLRFEK